MSVKTPFHSDFELFLLVADKKNISKAAESLGVGQSGLSKAIRRLEDETRSPLFVRRNQGVELTREGQRLARALRASQSAWTQTFAPDDEDHIEGRFSLGGHSSVLSVYLPAGLAKILKVHPKISLDVVPGTSLETTRKVAGLKMDLGLVVNHVKSPDLIARKIATDFIGLWKRRQSEPEFICYNPEMLDIGRHLRRLTGRRLVAIPDYPTIYRMILEGDCAGLLPNTLIAEPHLVINELKLREVQVSLIYHRQNAQRPVFRAISEALISTLDR